MNATTQEFGPCPCGCSDWRGGPYGTKLTRFGHLIGCVCDSCKGRRNRRKGQKGNARAHRRLGGTGLTVNDDLFHSYSLNVSVESKVGAQIPAHFMKAFGLEWTRHALHQATKKIPVGSDAYPTVYMETRPGDWWLVVHGSGSLR